MRTTTNQDYGALTFFSSHCVRYPALAKMSHFDDEKFKQLQLKVKFNVIPKTRLKKFGKLFDGYPTGLVKSEPGGFVMPPTYGENAEKIYRMKPRTDDVWLLTFPKCGKFKHKLFDGIRLL
jgi:hypothetical protein